MSRWLFFSLLLASCSPLEAWDDWNDALLDKKAGRFESPGTHLLPGSFWALSAAVDDEEGGALFAKRRGEDGDHLIIARLSGPSLLDPAANPPAICDAGPISFYGIYGEQRILTSTGIIPSGKTTLFAFREDEGGYGTIRLLKQDCTGPEITDVELGLSALYGDASVLGFLTKTRRGELLLIDARSFEARPLASGVESFFVASGGRTVWVHESGSLVRRDSEGRELERQGEGVTWVSGRNQAARFFYVDRRGLFALEAPSGRQTTEKLLTEDGCAPFPSPYGFGTFYFSPCAARRLNFQLANSGEAPVVWVGPELEHPIVASHYQRPVSGSKITKLFFVTGSDPERPRGRLYYVELPEAEVGGELVPQLLEDDALLEEDLLRVAPDEPNARLFSLPLWTSDTASPAAPLGVPLFERVHHWFYARHGDQLVPFVLADFDGTSGNLYPLWFGSSLRKPLLERVIPFSPSRYEGDATAVQLDRSVYSHFAVSLEDGDPRVRRIFDDPATPDSFDPLVSPPVGQDVASGTEVELFSPPSIVYRTRGSALRAHLTEADIDQLVHPRVSEFLALAWRPITGLVYVVPDGEEAGIWISKAR